MTICSPKLHIICGACGCNSMLEYSVFDGETTIHCRNCSFVVGISEVLPMRPSKIKERPANVTQQRHAAGAKATLPPDNAVCEHCLRSGEDECFGCQRGSMFINAATSA